MSANKWNILLNKKQISNKLPSLRSFQGLIDQLKDFLSKFNEIKNGNSSPILGLDIQQDEIKLLKLTGNGKKCRVNSFCQQDLPKGAIVKNEIQQPQTVSHAVKEAMKQIGESDCQVAVAIPRSFAIIKNINLSIHLSSEEIESRVWVEAQRHFPELINDIYLDFAVVGRSKNDDSQLDCLLVASRKNHVKPYLEIASECNLDIKIVDVDCFALERSMSLLENKPEEVTALINLNTHLSTIIVTQNDRLIYSHDQVFHGEKIKQQTDEYFKQNESLAQSDQLLEDQQYYNILRTNLMSHLRHTIHFFYTSYPNISIQKLWISGDCSTIKGLAQFVEKEMNIKTEIANPVAGLEMGDDVDADAFKQQASSLMLCCGLAMSKVEV